MPRHSPYALARLNFLHSVFQPFAVLTFFLELLEFLKTGFSQQKGRILFTLLFFHLSVKLFTLDWKDLFLVASIA